MVRPKPDIAQYKGIHILLSQENEHYSCVLDNGIACTYFPFYIERKFFHALFDSPHGTWTSVVLDTKDIIQGTAANIIHKFIDSPCEILLLLVSEAPSLERLGQLARFVFKDQDVPVSVHIQKEDSFSEIKKDADRQHLDSRYGRYCIEISFSQRKHKHTQDEMSLQIKSIRLMYTNPMEATVRDIIYEKGFRI